MFRSMAKSLFPTAILYLGSALLVALIGASGPVRANEAEANALFVEAVRMYRAAETLEGEARAGAMQSVRANIDRILAKHPESAVARRLRDDASPGGIDLAALPDASPQEQTPEACIQASMGQSPSQAIEVIVALDPEGRMKGIPRLDSPEEADAAVRQDFLAVTAAIDACAPLKIAYGETEFRVTLTPDGTANLAPLGDETSSDAISAGTASPVLPATPAVTAPPSATEAEEATLELDRQGTRDVQARLLVLGFDPNGIDGVIGRGTRVALRAWQESIGVAPTGFLNVAQLATLTSASETALAAWREDPENDRLYLPPPPVALGPGNMSGTWRFTSTCGPNSRLGNLRITGVLDIRHAGGNSYRGTARQSQGLRGQFSGRLEGRRVVGQINWGLLVGRVSFDGRIADQELIMNGRDSNRCRCYAAKR